MRGSVVTVAKSVSGGRMAAGLLSEQLVKTKTPINNKNIIALDRNFFIMVLTFLLFDMLGLYRIM